MSESTSYKTIATGQEAARKFDYFITALTGAVFSYLVNHLVPERLGWNYFTINLFSLLLLAASIYFGFRRIEMHHIMRFTNAQLLDHSEKAGSMMGVVADGKDGYNASTGEYFSVEKARVLYGQHQKAVQQIESSMEALNDKSALFYKLRNILLALGFFAIIASKVVEPYLQ